MKGKGRGWHGEPERHSRAARKKANKVSRAKARYIKAFERAVAYDTFRNRDRLVQAERQFDHAIAEAKL